MKAACYYGKEDIRVERVPDPQILNPRDAIVKVTSTAICGSDLHIYDGYIPTMERGDILQKTRAEMTRTEFEKKYAHFWLMLEVGSEEGAAGLFERM